MKKKAVAIVAICMIAMMLCVFAVACDSKGLSAYDLAVQNGYQGTLDQWLESLKGADGVDGKGRGKRKGRLRRKRRGKRQGRFGRQKRYRRSRYKR